MNREMSKYKTNSRSHNKAHDKYGGKKSKEESDDFLLSEYFKISVRPEKHDKSLPEMKLKMENSKRNVDILYAGVNFIKGSRYELEDISSSETDSKKPPTSLDEAPKQTRYFSGNTAIRCYKCRVS